MIQLQVRLDKKEQSAVKVEGNEVQRVDQSMRKASGGSNEWRSRVARESRAAGWKGRRDSKESARMNHGRADRKWARDLGWRFAGGRTGELVRWDKVNKSSACDVSRIEPENQPPGPWATKWVPAPAAPLAVQGAAESVDCQYLTAAFFFPFLFFFFSFQCSRLTRYCGGCLAVPR